MLNLYLPAAKTLSTFAQPELLSIKVSPSIEKNCAAVAGHSQEYVSETEWCYLKLVKKEECVILDSIEFESISNGDLELDTQYNNAELSSNAIATLFETSELIPSIGFSLAAYISKRITASNFESSSANSSENAFLDAASGFANELSVTATLAASITAC